MEFDDVIKMEFDPTGVAKANYVENEAVPIPDVLQNRVFTLRYGTFYSESLSIKTTDGVVLTKWEDYRPVYIYPEIMDKTDKTPCAFIQLLNNTLTGRLIVSYQVVGWPYNYSRQDLVDIFTAYQNSELQTCYWDDILNKPDAYPPTAHKLDLVDAYNWGDIIDAMNLFGTMLGNLDQYPQQDTIRDEIATLFQATKERFMSLETTLRNHELNTNNAHSLTINSLADLNSVKDYGMSTVNDITNIVTTKYVSPKVLRDYLDAKITSLYDDGVEVDRLPMLRFGAVNEEALPITYNGWVVTIGSIPAMLNWNEYTFPETTINLSAHPNSTIYIYARVIQHIPSYLWVVSTNKYPESSTCVSIASVVTDGSKITSLSTGKFGGIDFYRASETIRGSAITATSGLPTEPGKYAWKP